MLLLVLYPGMNDEEHVTNRTADAAAAQFAVLISHKLHLHQYLFAFHCLCNCQTSFIKKQKQTRNQLNLPMLLTTCQPSVTNNILVTCVALAVCGGGGTQSSHRLVQ